MQATEEGAILLTDAKGSYGKGLGEERLSILSPVQMFAEYAAACSAGGEPKPKSIRQNDNGQYIAEVFPLG